MCLLELGIAAFFPTGLRKDFLKFDLPVIDELTRIDIYCHSPLSDFALPTSRRASSFGSQAKITFEGPVWTEIPNQG